MNMISEIKTHLFIVSIQQFISLQNYFKIDHRVSKLLSEEVFDNISKFRSNITMKWPADNQNVHVSQKKSDTHSICICYLTNTMS